VGYEEGMQERDEMREGRDAASCMKGTHDGDVGWGGDNARPIDANHNMHQGRGASKQKGQQRQGTGVGNNR
jgi:hypothetical protein